MKRDNILNLWRKKGFYDGDDEKKAAVWHYLHLIQVYYGSYNVYA